MAAHKKIPGNRECQQHKNNILFILLSLVLFSDRMVSNCRRRERRVLYSEVIGSSPSRYSLYMMQWLFQQIFAGGRLPGQLKYRHPVINPWPTINALFSLHFQRRNIATIRKNAVQYSIASKPLKNYTDSILIMGLAIMPLQKSAEIRLFYREGT